MPASLDPQLRLDEKAITNPDLEAALERHLRAKDDVAEVKGVVKQAKAEVDVHLAAIKDFEPDTALRIGRFRITKRRVEGKTVSFSTDPRDQITIGLVDADGEPVKRPRVAKAVSVSDDADLQPTGEVNADALRGEAERSVIPEPTPIRAN